MLCLPLGCGSPTRGCRLRHLLCCFRSNISISVDSIWDNLLFVAEYFHVTFQNSSEIVSLTLLVGVTCIHVGSSCVVWLNLGYYQIEYHEMVSWSIYKVGLYCRCFWTFLFATICVYVLNYKLSSHVFICSRCLIARVNVAALLLVNYLI